MRTTNNRRRTARTARSRRLLFEPLENRLLLDAGPKIIQITPTEVRNSTFDHFDVAFNEAIAGATFTADDVAISGVSSSVDVASVTLLDATSFRINFTAFATRGNYSVAISPGIEDLDLSRNDQWDITDIRVATVEHLGGLAQDSASASAYVLGLSTLTYPFFSGASVLLTTRSFALRTNFS